MLKNKNGKALSQQLEKQPLVDFASMNSLNVIILFVRFQIIEKYAVLIAGVDTHRMDLSL